MSLNARMVRKADLVAERPGIIQPMLVPFRLTDQTRSTQAKTMFDIDPTGKTSVGGVQWAFQRPGLAAPLLVAKQDRARGLKEAEKIVAMDIPTVMTAKALSGWRYRR